jgi:sec-independent protein translocase protein TatC
MQYISYYFFELRLRSMYTLFAGVLSVALSYMYKYELFYLVSKPFLLFSTQFLFFELTEGLYTMIHIVSVISFSVLFPYSMYQFWSFSIPSYYSFERKKFFRFLWIFVFLFLIEFLFVYWFLFPKLCEFFLSFEINSLESQIERAPVSIEFTPRIASYIKLTIQLFSFFLLLFQLPFLFVGFFTKNILTSYNLCASRKFVFFVCVFFSAFISPPDIVSQLILSSVFYILYELIIFIGFFFESIDIS